MTLEDFIAGLRTEAGASDRPPPPVETWDPKQCGVADFEILSDGRWRHEGSIIQREALVRLFAGILRRDADGSYWLVTPSEKVEVRVADAPFVAIRADRYGQGPEQTVVLTTNLGDVVTLSATHPLRIQAGDEGAPALYALVRGRLEARILRAPYYELAAWGEEREGRFGVWSAGRFWALT